MKFHTLPLKSSRDHEDLWRTLEDPSLKCEIPKTWIAVTDFQEEGKFLNVSNQIYKDIFIGTGNAGVNLTTEIWGKYEPNGGVVENCVATQRSEFWSDERCHVELCISCLIKKNQEYKLRGLCKKTYFDTHYKLQGTIDAETQRHFFVGYHGWTLKYNTTLKGFKLSNVDFPKTYAVFNDTTSYPMGLEKWVIVGDDNCKYSTPHTLFFSSCSIGEFTCDDGSCISIDERCNKVSDCSDKSDENDCYKVRFNEQSYNKHMAPVDKYDSDRRIKITFNISDLEIVDIDYLESYFTSRFTLEMTWIDRRLTFQNLRVLDNVLDAHEIGK